jgi:hypothetical protein
MALIEKTGDVLASVATLIMNNKTSDNRGDTTLTLVNMKTSQ